MYSRVASSLLIALLVLAVPVHAGQDGSLLLQPLQILPDGSVGDVLYSCTAPVTTLSQGMLGMIAFGVYAQLSGASRAGIAGGEFYVEGLETGQIPTGWTKTASVAPTALDIGSWSDPIQAGAETVRRVNVSWPVDGYEALGCQKDYLVFLGRIELRSPYGDPSFSPGTLARIVGGNPPSDPAFACPLLVLCDAPVFTKVCVTGGTMGVGLPSVPPLVDPVPADQTTDVTVAPTLRWSCSGQYVCCGIGTPFTRVFFGTSADPPLVFTNYDDQQFSFEPSGVLNPSTTYYWRIESTPDHDCGSASSPVWSFTTTNTVSVTAKSWTTVKELFRD